ncbi:MAG: head-tail adaptor protein [Alphaproteobacteria bacterium]|nr:head-tail adaptor protein [Alphaproteobacteria bacterium]
MTISIRDLRERVRVEHAVLRINEQGELSENYRSSHEIWACIKSKGYHRLSHVQGTCTQNSNDRQASYTITVRYDPTLQKGTRIADKDRYYHVIAAPTHDAKKRWTLMEAIVFPKPREIDHA